MAEKIIKARDSNMELLRIVAMFLVMIIHADFLGWGMPTSEDVNEMPLGAFARLFIGALSVVCVNVFVMISGWYGISLTIKRISKLLLQVVFFSVLLFLLFPPSGQFVDNCMKELIDICLLKGYWFVGAYLLLCIMAPTLNVFAEHASKKQFKGLLIAFFIFQTIFSYIANSQWWSDGYSPLTFWGLYLLARYLRLYPNRFTTMVKKNDLLVYLSVSFVIAITSMGLLYYANTGGRLYNYTSPLTIVASVFFFLFFSKLSLHSKFVNWVASSCFAVYLVHVNSHFVGDYFANIIHEWSESQSVILALLFTVAYIVIIYCCSIVVDKLRIILVIHFNQWMRR